jgi:Cys-tRNA(Pro) deacylase
MQGHSIQGEILHLDVPTPTVETAAQALGTQPEQIVKSILFIVDDQALLAITCGTHLVERRAIADLYGVGRKRVKLASPGRVQEITGYEVGAMPPFGHRQPIPTLLDRRVLDLPMVYAGGGAENVLLRVNPEEITRVTGASVMDLIEPKGAISNTSNNTVF